ncbi:hypothetical protein BJV77DRAFT_981241 [Russula vinacea]|nr:hypothetical protein BJV77DRAFT_981241 [Russula vinacea]
MNWIVQRQGAPPPRSRSKMSLKRQWPPYAQCRSSRGFDALCICSHTHSSAARRAIASGLASTERQGVGGARRHIMSQHSRRSTRSCASP